MKNLKFEYGNLPNESLDQEKHFKHVFEVGVGWEFEKTWIKIKNIRASADIYWFLLKKSVHLLEATFSYGRHGNPDPIMQSDSLKDWNNTPDGSVTSPT